MKLKFKYNIFALIAALALVQGPRVLALSSPSAQGAPVENAAASLADAGQTSKNVDLEFELLPPAMSGEPNRLVQLDRPSPATGADSTFAGLEPGVHTARVILMDDNDQPMQGGIAMVHFRVHPAATASSLEIQGAAAPAPPPPVPPELRDDADPGLPLHGSPLLLVSLIGFALLIGGILPGIRSRKVTTVHP